MCVGPSVFVLRTLVEEGVLTSRFPRSLVLGKSLSETGHWASRSDLRTFLAQILVESSFSVVVSRCAARLLQFTSVRSPENVLKTALTENSH
jgi:hypothetical protein